jgi:predicted HTH domain antitoxin
VSGTDLVPQPVAVDPRDGAILTLADAPAEQLADVLLELRRREAQMKEWRTAVEDELVRRHGDRRAAQVVGDHEIDVDRGHSRVWDPEELELVAVDLVARGLLSLHDISGLIARAPKVDGRKAMALLNRVDGDALVELRRCFEWETKGRPKVKVTPVASLEPGEDA